MSRVSPEPAEIRLAGFRYVIGVLLLLAVYFMTAKVGLLMDAVSGFATTVWPPTGIALVALTLFGYRLWPGIALGALFVNLSAGAAPLVACGMAAGNTLEALLGVYLLRRFAGFTGSLDRVSTVLKFIVLAAGLSTMVSASLGVASAYVGGIIPPSEWPRAWLTWWLGDAMGDLVLAPLLFIWRRPAPRLTIPQLIEAGALLAALLAVTIVVFGAGMAVDWSLPLGRYMVYPVLIWAALRFGQHGAVTTMFLIASLAIVGTTYTGISLHEKLGESLLLLQAFMGIAAGTALILSADVTQRRRAERALRRAQVDLERRVERRTIQLSESNRMLEREIGKRNQVARSLEDLSTRLLNVQDEERQSLARELHDSTAQILAALSLNLAVAGRSRERLDEQGQASLDESIELASRCSQEIRSLSYLLHPPLLSEVGLPAALRWLVDGFSRRSSIEVVLEVAKDFGRLPREMEGALFRVVQECLTNVQRHSRSATASIHLTRDEGKISLVVRDEGRGISPEVLTQHGDVTLLGVGILGMRERVRQLGGRLGIDSTEHGTQVSVEIPISGEAA